MKEKRKSRKENNCKLEILDLISSIHITTSIKQVRIRGSTYRSHMFKSY